MINSKQLLLITLVIVGLGLAAQFYSNQKSSFVASKQFEPLLETQAINQIDHILIQRGSISLHLKLQNGSWVLPAKNNFPASKSKILKLLSQLVRVRPASLVTEDATKLESFDLGKAENEHSEYGNKLKLMGGDKVLFALHLGRARAAKGQTTGGVFAQVNNTAKVYLLKESIHLAYMPEDWLETTIVALPKSKIQSLVSQHEGASVDLARSDQNQDFTLSGNQKPIETAVNALFRELELMTLIDVVTHSKAKELKLRPKANVVITLFSGAALAFEVLEENLPEERNYYLRFAPPPNEEAQKAFPELFSLSKVWIFQVQEWQATKWTYAAENLVPGAR